MSQTLTSEIVLKKTKNDSLNAVKNLNLWGYSLKDISEIKNLPNLETCALSVNEIDSFEPFSHCKHLQELFLRKNKIAEFQQLKYLMELPNLKVLWLSDNPITNLDDYRLFTIALLPNLTKLDQVDITEEERQAARQKFPDPVSKLSSPEPEPAAQETPEQEAALNAIRALLPHMGPTELTALRAAVITARTKK